MKIFILTDLEGVAGVVTFYEQTSPDGKYYEKAKSLLTAEVNAAVDAAFLEGATEVLVLDGHGPGAICFEELHPSAKLAHGRPFIDFVGFTRQVLAGQYDVGMIIGQHAMAGHPTGNMNHTQNSKMIECYILNGKPIGEIAMTALMLGGVDIPLIFLSGDDAACTEAEDLLPGIVTTSVKQGLGRNCAISVSAIEARKRIKDGVIRSIRTHRQNPMQALKWEGPYVMEKRFFHTDVADMTVARNGAERVDARTVRYRSDSIMDVIDK